MNKKITLFVLSTLCIIALSAQNYTRIISLAPSLTESLYYLGAEDKLVGRTNYCVVAENDDIPIVASAVSLNMEKAIAMKPDLVLVLELTDQKDIETLRKFGIQVETFKTPKSFEEICEQFIHLGRIVGKTDVAKQIVAESSKRVQEIQKKYKEKPTTKIFFQIGSNPLFTVLPNTFMNDFITLMGGENISNELSKGIIGREFVLGKNPDYIFICTMGTASEQEEKMWKSYTSINAVKNDKVFTIDAAIACQPTPITFVKTIEVMHKAMNE